MAGRNWDQEQYRRQQHGGRGGGDYHFYRGARGRDVARDYERFGERDLGGREERVDRYSGGRYGREAFRDDYDRGGFDERGVRYSDDMRGGYRETRGYGVEMDRSGNYDFSSQSYMQPGEFSGRGPKGYQRSDERIREDVCEVLTRHPGIDAIDIEVEVQNREVTLRGLVPERRMKRLAEDVVEGLSGVHDVHNELKVTQASIMQKMAEEIDVAEGREQKGSPRSSKSSSTTQSSRT